MNESAAVNVQVEMPLQVYMVKYQKLLEQVINKKIENLSKKLLNKMDIMQQICQDSRIKKDQELQNMVTTLKTFFTRQQIHSFVAGK